MLFGKSQNIKDNVAELRKYIPNINTTFDFEKLRNFINSSAEKYIKPVLGTETFNYLVDYYENEKLPQYQGSGSGSGSGSGGSSDDLKTAYDKLLNKSQYALASLSVFKGYHLLNLKIGDSGIHIEQPEGTRGTFKYEETEIKNSLKAEGYNALDTILEFLESNKVLFPEWVQSNSYTISRSLIINSATDFNKYYPRINSSRLVFLSLMPYIQMVEDFNILPSIGRAYYDELKKQILDNDISEDNELIINKLKFAVANLAIWKGINELSVNIADKGVFFYGMESIDKQADLITPIDGNMLDKLKANAYLNGLNYIQYAKDILDNSADNKYETYKQSDAYTSGGGSNLLNSTDKKTFRL